MEQDVVLNGASRDPTSSSIVALCLMAKGLKVSPTSNHNRASARWASHRQAGRCSMGRVKPARALLRLFSGSAEMRSLGRGWLGEGTASRQMLSRECRTSETGRSFWSCRGRSVGR
jgi:hypothetical protein